MAAPEHPSTTEAKAAGLSDEHIEAMHTLTDAIGCHTAVYDALVKQIPGETIYPAGDIHSRVFQCFKLLQTKPGFAEKFSAEMDKHYDVVAKKSKHK